MNRAILTAVSTSVAPRLIATMAVLLAGMMALSACNTIDGAGRDVSATGNAASRAAERNTPR